MYSNKTLRGFRVSFPKIVVFHWLDYSRYTLKPSETVLSINPKYLTDGIISVIQVIYDNS